MGMPELMRDIHSAVEPDSVRAMMAFTSMWLAVYITAMAMASSTLVKRCSLRTRERVVRRLFSAPRHTRAMASTVLSGYLPVAVSAESITASVPSMTALATSSTSARVGTGLWIMDSIIWVAVMTVRL